MNMIAIKEKDSDYELIENKEKKETLYSKCIWSCFYTELSI